MSDTTLSNSSSADVPSAADSAATPSTPTSPQGVAAIPLGRIWTNEQDAELKVLHLAGFSGSQIAGFLNEKFSTNYSRNAVIGRTFRLQLSPRGQGKWPANRKGQKKRKPQQRLFRAKPVFVVDKRGLRCAEVEPLHLNLIDLQSGQCHWPYGDGPFTFCGHPVLDGSYCFEHASLSYKEAA